MSLRPGDIVLVCVTAFKGQHKTGGRTEYMAEWHPYPDLPIYVLHSIDREGHSHILHRNYLLPIKNSLENRMSAKSVGGDEAINIYHPDLHKIDALPVGNLARSQPDSALNLPQGLDELVILKMTGLTTTGMDLVIIVSDISSKVNKTPPNYDDLFDGAPTDDIHSYFLRCSSRSTKSKLPKRYKHFLLQQSTTPFGYL